MALYYLLDNGIELALFCFENNVWVVNSDNRLICRYLDNVELIDLSELVLLSKGSTCHT